MFYFLLLLLLFFAILLIKTISFHVFIAVVSAIESFTEMRNRKKKDSEITNEKIYDKTDPYWELQKKLDEFNKFLNKDLQNQPNEKP